MSSKAFTKRWMPQTIWFSQRFEIISIQSAFLRWVFLPQVWLVFIVIWWNGSKNVKKPAYAFWQALIWFLQGSVKCEFEPRTFPKPVFVFIFTAVFKISIKFECFLRPFVLAMRATFGEIPAMRRCEQRCVRCVRDSMACFLRFGLCDAKLRCASRDLRCAMRDS